MPRFLRMGLPGVFYLCTVVWMYSGRQHEKRGKYHFPLFFIVHDVLMGAFLERMPHALEAIPGEWGKT